MIHESDNVYKKIWKPISNKMQLHCLSRMWSILWRLIYVYQDYSSMIFFFTQGTLIWFLPSMSPHMHVKITCPWKCFITLGALIWFLPSMSHHMPVTFLPGMSHHMFIKTTLHWKCFFPHRVHWYGFFPVWVIICWFRLLIHENAFSHRVHWYGVSLVWVITYIPRVL